jgi:serine/threonine-protein kinase
MNLPAIAPPVTRVPLAAGPKRLVRAALWAIAGLMSLIAGVALWTSVRSSPPPPAQVVRFPISLPQSQMLNEQDSEIAVSPDGKRLVYLGGVGATRQLFLRELDQVEGKELPETKGASQPFFSPDGQSIGFQAGGKLKTLFLNGGRPKILCDASKLAGGTWCPDNTIFFTPAWSMGIWKVSADGGDPEQVTTPKKEKGEFGHWWPEVLPGGEAVLFTIWKTSLKDTQVAALIRETGESRILVTGASHARYAPTGHLLYAQSGTLVAAPFDLKQLKVGDPRPVIEGLKQYPDSGYAPFSFSRDGLLCYVRGGEWLASRQFVWVNRNGQGVEPLPLPPQAYADPRISPDGRRIAFTKFDRGAFNIWVHELPSGPATQITFESSNFLPVWMPDGNTLTFTSYRAGPFDVYSMPADRSGPEELLLTGSCDHIATAWSPDGKVLLFIEINPDTGEDIGLLSTDDANTPRPLLHETCAEVHAIFSPDGNSLVSYVN